MHMKKAENTGLFRNGDIKVHIRTYTDFSVGGNHSDFIHVFGYIKQGDNTEQRNIYLFRLPTTTTNWYSFPNLQQHHIPLNKVIFGNKNRFHSSGRVCLYHIFHLHRIDDHQSIPFFYLGTFFH